MKKAAKRTPCTFLAILLTLGLAACGGSKTVDPKTCTYDEMVDYPLISPSSYVLSEKRLCPIPYRIG